MVSTVFFAATTLAAAQSPTPSEPTEVRLETANLLLAVAVWTPQGRPLTGLQPADFEVTINGARQPVIALHQSPPEPVHLQVLWDVSSSARHQLRRKRELLSSFIKKFFTTADDRLGLAVFNEELQSLAAPTNDRRRLLAAVNGVTTAEGGTALFDALLRLGAELPSPSGAARVALLALTDGGDNASYATRDDVAAMARVLGLPVYALRLPDGASRRVEGSPTLNRGERDLQALCRATGGEAFFLSANDDPEEVLLNLTRHLRRHYTLVVEPVDGSAPPPGSPVEVRLPRRPDARVGVRRSRALWE